MAAGEEGDHVGCGSTGATCNQDGSDGQGEGQLEQAGYGPAHEGHDDVLGDDPDRDCARHCFNLFKVVDAERDAHAEHDDGEAISDPVTVEPGDGWRVEDS